MSLQLRVAAVVVTEGDQNEGDVGDPHDCGACKRPATQIPSMSLNNKLRISSVSSVEEVVEDYAVGEWGRSPATLLRDGNWRMCRAEIERALQGVIEVLDNQDYDVILRTRHPLKDSARNAILLEPMRLSPAGGLYC